MLADPSASGTTLPLYHGLRTTEHQDDPYGPLVKCLGQEEEFAVLASLRLLGLLVAYVLLTRPPMVAHVRLAFRIGQADRAGPTHNLSPSPSSRHS